MAASAAPDQEGREVSFKQYVFRTSSDYMLVAYVQDHSGVKGSSVVVRVCVRVVGLFNVPCSWFRLSATHNESGGKRTFFLPTIDCLSSMHPPLLSCGDCLQICLLGYDVAIQHRRPPYFLRRE